MGIRNRAEATFVRRLLESPRYEVLPTGSIVDDVARHLPAGRTVTVTASVGRGLSATIDTAERLQQLGFRAVPHLAARMVSGANELADAVGRLEAAGVDSVFVPGGDATPPAGPYASSLDLLRELRDMSAPFTHIGIAGYPESHPVIDDDELVRAMRDKQEYATHIVSNMCFDPAVLTAWIRQVRDRGIGLPLFIGMPGRVEPAKLLSVATKIGVGESTRFLVKNKSALARIAMPGRYSPKRFLGNLAASSFDPQASIAGLHVYTFNQVAATEKWRTAWAARLARSWPFEWPSRPDAA